MKHLQTYEEDLHFLMERLDFPADAKEALLRAFSIICSQDDEEKTFSSILKCYEKTELCPFSQMLEEACLVGKRLKIHEYTVSLLMFLCMAKVLRRRYEERGIPETIYFNSMMDLRYKLEECRLVYGICGSFVARWFPRFFDLTRFALGRLQFEMVAFKKDYVLDGVLLSQGSKAINVHIPRDGTRLDYHRVWESYREAAEMFSSEFSSGSIIFTCHSWLLDPWNLTVLNPESNLALFSKDYQLIEHGDYSGYFEMWRLFDCNCEDLSGLPSDSSLRRAYLERMKRGEPIGWGRGAFFYPKK